MIHIKGRTGDWAFENGVLRRIFGSKREMGQVLGESFMIMILICTPRQMLLQ
jgi:hypothetical protein